jgi:hypothetical protein
MACSCKGYQRNLSKFYAGSFPPTEQAQRGALVLLQFRRPLKGSTVMVMNNATLRATAGLVLFGTCFGAGCEGDSRPGEAGQRAALGRIEQRSSSPTASDSTAADPFAGAKRTELGTHVWLETKGQQRRVVVGAVVCLREGSYGLECLLCRRHTKEHESILATDAEGKTIHAALLLAKAVPGSPVRYEEKNGETRVIPPRGSPVQVLVRYPDKGKPVVVPAQKWVQKGKTTKTLEQAWVFAGSMLNPDPDDRSKTHYAADGEGSYISILNGPAAILDLPINNPNRDPSEREYQPYTERIPEVGTQVEILLQPQPEAKINNRPTRAK